MGIWRAKPIESLAYLTAGPDLDGRASILENFGRVCEAGSVVSESALLSGANLQILAIRALPVMN